MRADPSDELDLMKQRVLEQAKRMSPRGVRSLDLIPDPEHREVIFRLEAESDADRARLLSCFGGVEVGSAMYFRRPLPQPPA